MKKLHVAFIIFLFCSLFQSYSQADCATALPLCTNANSGGVVNGFGVDDFNGRDESGCLKLGLGVNTIETNSFWFRIKLAENGQFGFNIIPNDLSEDWDFGVYGPNPTCGALENPIACNYSKVSTTGYTGVGEDPINPTETAAYDSWMNVIAGDEYVILINQYDGNNAGFSIEWKGAVITNNLEPLDCSILVNLGPDRDLCTGQSTVLNATTFGNSVTYEWFLLNTPIPSETSATLLVNSTGNYKVEVTDTDTGEVKNDEIIVTIHDIPIANAVSDIIHCDSDNNGVENFNLESRTSAIIDGQPGMSVTYHESEIFAKAGAAPKTSPYTSAGTTIWARIANDANTNCYDITSFKVLITPPPTVTQPPTLKECDDDGDGLMIFNLDSQTPIILSGQPVMFITYYSDEANANDHKGWIVNTAAYATKTRTIWVRVESAPGSNCYALTSFNIEVLDSAIANKPTDIQQCDDNNDGVYQFDFNAMKDAEILGTQSPSIFEINYFETQADADANVNILPNPYSNITPYGFETIYARIQNKGSADCYATTNFTIQVFDSAFPSTNISDLTYCDDMSDGDDTNGFYEFNLTEREIDILAGQSPLVFDITYFENPDYSVASQINNPLAYTNSVIGGQTIYVRVTNSNINNTFCFSDTSFNIVVEPLPKVLLTVFDFQQCDEDGVTDGIIDFNLAEADSFLNLGDSTLNVSYYLTPLDAASGTNPQTKYPFSNSITNTLYSRVESVNGCYRIVPVNLAVSVSSIPANYSRELIECDDDSTNDGIHIFNLSQTRSEILALFQPAQNLRVAFYRNGEDAISESNNINPDNAYINEIPFNQTIWVRVESSLNGGCFGIAPVIELTVLPRPEFDLDITDVVCLNNPPLSVSTYNANDIYTYEWTNELGVPVSDQPTADIIQAGVYTVVATSNEGCDSFPKQITITESNIASISSDDVQINDNSSNNYITINTANQNLGIGDYEFSLDDSTGPYQDNSTFTEVIPGEHIIFVREKNECGISQVTVYVFGFPNFFTPNGDGDNDTWNVQGIDSSIFPESKIYIYDRYGKMLTNFNTTQLGWNGMYNKNKAISSDYWYLAQITDFNGVTREYKGHFSLIRR